MASMWDDAEVVKTEYGISAISHRSSLAIFYSELVGPYVTNKCYKIIPPRQIIPSYHPKSYHPTSYSEDSPGKNI